MRSPEPSREGDACEHGWGTRRPTHRQHRETECKRGGRQDDAAAETIDQAADAQTEQAADQRRDEVHLRVGDASDVQVAKQGLVMRPSPWVRPGSVPIMAAHATPSTTHP